MIKVLCMDVDGTLTNGKLHIGQTGEIYKSFDVKDGLGITRKLPRAGIIPVIITGKKSDIVLSRCDELGITEIYQGVDNKLGVLQQMVDRKGITFDEVAYIGDDENDLECMSICKISACPSDAVQSVKTIVDFVCNSTGGNGAVREFIDYLLENDCF